MKKESVSVIIIAIAVFAASIVTNILVGSGFEFEYLYLPGELIPVRLTDNVWNTFFIVFFQRLRQLVIIYLFMKVFEPEKIYALLAVMLGSLYGLLACTQSYYGGLDGLALICLYVFPHYIIYMALIGWCSRAINQSGIQRGKKIFVVLVGLVAGVVCECFISRFFLIQFYQHMVHM